MLGNNNTSGSNNMLTEVMGLIISVILLGMLAALGVLSEFGYAVGGIALIFGPLFLCIIAIVASGALKIVGVEIPLWAIVVGIVFAIVWIFISTYFFLPGLLANLKAIGNAFIPLLQPVVINGSLNLS